MSISILVASSPLPSAITSSILCLLYVAKTKTLFLVDIKASASVILLFTSESSCVTRAPVKISKPLLPSSILSGLFLVNVFLASSITEVILLLVKSVKCTSLKF